jgi:hypothetical protein
MALSKATRLTTTNNKKTTASSKTKPSAKKQKEKVSMMKNPLEKLDEHIDSIAILGERRDNAARLSKQSHDFSLATVLPKVLKEHPDCEVWISGGSPQLLQDGKSLIPVLLLHLVQDGKSPPPFVAYSVKDELEIQELSKHKLAWSKVAPRVNILKSTRRMTKRSIEALTDDALAMEEHVQLWTLIPREKLQLNSKGKIDVTFANFVVPTQQEGGGEPIFGSYEKGAGLQDCIDRYVEEYGEEIGDDAETKIKIAIQEAFAEARNKLETQKMLLENAGYSEELLDSIQIFKLFPKGTDEALVKASSYINRYYNRADEVMSA